MREREIEHAADELRRHGRRAVQRGSLAALAAALALGVLPSWPHLALSLLAGAAGEACLAANSAFARRACIARLALDPGAYVLPEVREYGRRSAEPRERERLAAWLAEIAADAHVPGSLYLGDRVAASAGELASIARDLASPTFKIEPSSAAECRLLLTDAVRSPLYNPRLPPHHLRDTLARIRSGIHSSHG